MQDFTAAVVLKATVYLVLATVAVALIGAIVSLVGIGEQISNAWQFGATILQLASTMAFAAIALGAGAVALAILHKE